MLNYFVDGENYELKLSWNGEEPPAGKDLEKVFAKLREEIRWTQEEELSDVDLDSADQKTFDRVRDFQEGRRKSRNE